MIEIENRKAENVEAVADHRRLERLLAHHHLDHLAGVEAGVADHPDDAVVGFDIDHERVGDERDPRGVVQIVGPIDLSRHVHFDDQGAGTGTLHGDGLDLGAFEQLVAQHRGKLAARRRLGGERGDLGGRQALHQPLATEIGYRGHEHQHLGQHHEQNGEQQQLGRQSRHVAGHSPGVRGWFWGLVVHDNHSIRKRSGALGRYPKRRRKPMMLRSQPFVKVGK